MTTFTVDALTLALLTLAERGERTHCSEPAPPNYGSPIGRVMRQKALRPPDRIADLIAQRQPVQARPRPEAARCSAPFQRNAEPDRARSAASHSPGSAPGRTPRGRRSGAPPSDAHRR